MKIIDLENIDLEEMVSYRDPDDLLTWQETSELLRVKSFKSLYVWRHYGPKIPYIKIRRTIRYRYGDIVEFIKKHRIESFSWHDEC